MAFKMLCVGTFLQALQILHKAESIMSSMQYNQHLLPLPSGSKTHMFVGTGCFPNNLPNIAIMATLVTGYVCDYTRVGLMLETDNIRRAKGIIQKLIPYFKPHTLKCIGKGTREEAAVSDELRARKPLQLWDMVGWLHIQVKHTCLPPQIPCPLSLCYGLDTNTPDTSTGSKHGDALPTPNQQSDLKPNYSSALSP